MTSSVFKARYHQLFRTYFFLKYYHTKEFFYQAIVHFDFLNCKKKIPNQIT